ncbi:hypothetical protein BaRGS_00032266 [Batillaria attramentaria]|uniref:Uncharacterized protein n=1 Tax=Batillaria attramentaria TaxID=370345 RepID=A0ABD0JP97_9CAEN
MAASLLVERVVRGKAWLVWKQGLLMICKEGCFVAKLMGSVHMGGHYRLDGSDNPVISFYPSRSLLQPGGHYGLDGSENPVSNFYPSRSLLQPACLHGWSTF